MDESSKNPSASSIEKYKCSDCGHVGWTTLGKGCRKCGAKNLVRFEESHVPDKDAEPAKVKKNYMPAIISLIVGVIALAISYSGSETHFVIRGTDISFGWLAIVYSIFKFIAPSEE